MEWLDIDVELDRLQKSDWGKAVEIVNLVDEFPDLRLFKDCWGNVKFCSRAANPMVDSMEIDSCHNCDGQPMKAWPYVIVSPVGTRLYSDPPYFVVADQNQNGFGEVPRTDWLEDMQDSIISEEVTKKIDRHLKAHPPINYKD